MLLWCAPQLKRGNEAPCSGGLFYFTRAPAYFSPRFIYELPCGVGVGVSSSIFFLGLREGDGIGLVEGRRGEGDRDRKICD